MKNVLAVFSIVLSSLFSLAQNSENYTVPTTAKINSAGHVELSFQMDKWGTTYTVYRMNKGEKNWGDAITVMSGGDSTVWATYIDEETEKGKVYEYRIYKTGVGNFLGTGYIMTGAEIEAVHERGVLLMLVESSLMDDAASEINDHAMDIAADGWNVVMRLIPTQENTVPKVRSVVDQTISEEGEVEAIYILGHVAVPYSGQYCNDRYYTVPPDGHGPGQGDHCGAWPADVYYAVHDVNWTDLDSTTVDSRREANKNRIGDGKFDQIQIPADVTTQLGRVDLSNLSNFSQSESELVKRYIAKNKDYRYLKSKVYYKGLVDENFSASIGAFASTAWRNFSSIIGPGLTEEKDFFTTLQDSTYIFAYGTGGGSYTSCNGVGKSTDYVTKNTAIFNLLFGSFFGDWDVANNFLRSALATEKGGLTNSWSGRPWWHLHPMGMGESIGYCTRLTQNQNQRYQDRQTYLSSVFGHNIHIALMGDPSLRLYMFEGAENLKVTTNAARDNVDLTWDVSQASGVLGYHVYYSWSPTGPYVRVNHDLITSTNFSHAAPFDGDTYYMVRAERLETTPSGSFYNLSQGIVEKVDDLDAVGIAKLSYQTELKVYPNPTNEALNIEFQKMIAEDIEYSITDIKGHVVYSGSRGGPVGWNRFTISLAGLQNGVYQIRVDNKIQRIVVMH